MCLCVCVMHIPWCMCGRVDCFHRVSSRNGTQPARPRHSSRCQSSWPGVFLFLPIINQLLFLRQPSLFGAGIAAWIVQCVSSMHKAMTLSPSINKGTMEYTCKPQNSGGSAVSSPASSWPPQYETFPYLNEGKKMRKKNRLFKMQSSAEEQRAKPQFSRF